MSISTELSRIQTDRNTIRTKLVSLGLVASSANLDACANAIQGIENRGAVSATVQEGDTYTIPAGYHNGTGTVSGVAGGGNYSLQSKTITPTKTQQAITPDSGYYGLSDVTVGAIPEAFRLNRQRNLRTEPGRQLPWMNHQIQRKEVSRHDISCSADLALCDPSDDRGACRRVR